MALVLHSESHRVSRVRFSICRCTPGGSFDDFVRRRRRRHCHGIPFCFSSFWFLVLLWLSFVAWQAVRPVDVSFGFDFVSCCRCSFPYLPFLLCLLLLLVMVFRGTCSVKLYFRSFHTLRYGLLRGASALFLEFGGSAALSQSQKVVLETQREGRDKDGRLSVTFALA